MKKTKSLKGVPIVRVKMVIILSKKKKKKKKKKNHNMCIDFRTQQGAYCYYFHTWDQVIIMSLNEQNNL